MIKVDEIVGAPVSQRFVVLAGSQAELERVPHTVRALTLGTDRVVDLRPLARFTQLETLQIDDAAVNDFAVLARLPKLRELSLYDNGQLEDLSFLAALPGLEALTVGNCWDRAPLPIRGLSSVTRKLRRLRLFGTTRAGTLAWLSERDRLEELLVHDGSVDARWLAPLRRLKQLTLTRTRTDTLAPLAGLTRLTWLAVTQSKVRDVRPLASLARLETLLLSFNAIDDAAPLTALRQLERLELGHNRLTRLPRALGQLTRLETLAVSNNPLERLPNLRGLKRLTSLDLGKTRVRNLSPLAGAVALTSLGLMGTRADSLSPLSQHPALVAVHLGSSKIDRRPLASIATLVRVTPVVVRSVR